MDMIIIPGEHAAESYSVSSSWNYVFHPATQAAFYIPACSNSLSHSSLHAYSAKAGMLDKENQIFHTLINAGPCWPEHRIAGRRIWARKVRWKGYSSMFARVPLSKRKWGKLHSMWHYRYKTSPHMKTRRKLWLWFQSSLAGENWEQATEASTVMLEGRKAILQTVNRCVCSH